jgi:Phage antirepressor protein KilAC domain./BRO family, N-terminal domain.
LNALQVFKNPSFGQLTVIIENGKELFKLEDVAWALGYTKEAKGNRYLRWERINNILQKLDISTVVRDGQQYVDESGLYDFVFESGTEKAQEFRKWVRAEVLPTIRRTGGYVANDEVFIETYLPFADEQTKQTFRATLALVRKQNEQIALMKPKADYFDALVDRNLLTNFRDTAKELHIGPKAFIEWLLEKKYIYRDTKGKLKPYAQYVPDLFQLKEWERNGKADVQTLVTPKGRETFRLFLKKEVSG